MKSRSSQNRTGRSIVPVALVLNRLFISRRLTSILTFIGLFITLLVLTQSSVPASQAEALPADANRAAAERMWELMIKAKGSRERLHAVTNVQMSEHLKYLWGFRILRIDYEGLFVFPNKSWEWDDQRGTVFGFMIRVHNFDRGLHLSYVGERKDGSVVPIMRPGMRNFTTLQLHLFGETKWVRPIPESFRSETMEGRMVDIVQTRVKDFPENEQKIEFALDRKTHLPMKVTYHWTRENRKLSGGLELKDYVEVDGIKMPSRVGRTRPTYRINVDYNPQLFEQPPSREAGIDAWQRK